MNGPRVEALPAKEFLVIKGYAKLYDRNTDGEADAWDVIRRRLRDGTIERLKKVAGSETVYMLFCNTCVRNEEEMCYDCCYDVACENLNKAEAGDEFEIVRLLPCEYAVYEFAYKKPMGQAHEKSDDLFWGSFLKKNPYTSAIDDPANWIGNGYASIELYTPFDPDAAKFTAKTWYPILRKQEKPT